MNEFVRSSWTPKTRPVQRGKRHMSKQAFKASDNHCHMCGVFCSSDLHCIDCNNKRLKEMSRGKDPCKECHVK